MAERREFDKLLSEAPMAQEADTVTVVGSLARTKEPGRFVLRTPDGRSVTLDVDAVKSAKPIAGAIGQSLVELELDAKLVPEQWYKAGPDYTASYIDYQIPPIGHGGGGGYTRKEIIEVAYPTAGQPVEMMATAGGYGTRTYLTGYTWTTDHHVVEKPTYDAAAPFAAAMPHQSDPATRATLTAYSFGGRRTYITAYDWTTDHPYQKPFADPPF